MFGKKSEIKDALELIKSRRSIRKYADKPVPDELIKRVTEAGAWAPSSNHSEPVEFIIVKKETTRLELSKISPWSGFIAKAPAVIAVASSKESDCYLQDGSIAVMNMMLEAHSLGLGTCWVETTNAEQMIKDLLKIPTITK